MNFGTKGCMYCDGECNKECLSQEESKQETVKVPCSLCDGTGETVFSGTYTTQRKCDLCNGEKYWDKKVLVEQSKQETLEERIEHITFLHKQNLNGRETEDELFEAGILAGIEETEERMFELHDKWEKYTKDNYHPDFSSMSFKSYVENFNNKKL